MLRHATIAMVAITLSTPVYSDAINPRSPFYQALSCALVVGKMKQAGDENPQFRKAFSKYWSGLAAMQKSAVARVKQVKANHTTGELEKYRRDFESEFDSMIEEQDVDKMWTMVQRCQNDFGPDGKYALSEEDSDEDVSPRRHSSPSRDRW